MNWNCFSIINLPWKLIWVLFNIFVISYPLKVLAVWELYYEPLPLPEMLLPQYHLAVPLMIRSELISPSQRVLSWIHCQKLHSHHFISVTWVSFLLTIHHCLTFISCLLFVYCTEDINAGNRSFPAWHIAKSRTVGR